MSGFCLIFSMHSSENFNLEEKQDASIPFADARIYEISQVFKFGADRWARIRAQCESNRLGNSGTCRPRIAGSVARGSPGGRHCSSLLFATAGKCLSVCKVEKP